MYSETFINSCFASYRPCVEEIKNISIRRADFFYSLPGTIIKGISYEDYVDGASEDNILSVISDYMQEWDAQNKGVKKHCLKVIEICNSLLSRMDKEQELIFVLRFIDGLNLNEVAMILNYSKGNISKIIRKECSRLSLKTINNVSGERYGLL